MTRRRLSAALVSLVLPISFLGAQQGAAAGVATGDPAVDSATIARAAWARVTAAARGNDLAAAGKAAGEATRAWPTQEAYIWGSAVLAAQTGDTAGVLSGLKDYAAIGLGRDVRAHPVLGAFGDLPSYRDVIAAHDRNRAPLVNGVPRTVIADSLFWPEGFDIDTISGKYYIASVYYRTIAEFDPKTGVSREIMLRFIPTVGSILGVRVDAARGVLWATTAGLPQMQSYKPADSTIAALLKIRIKDGVIERRWDLPASPNGHTLGDLAIGPNGDVFFTDSRDPVFYWLKPGRDLFEYFRHPLFQSLQGIAPTPDGKVVYIADYSHGLIRMDLATQVMSRLSDAPNSTSLGLDGLAWDRGAIVGVQNGVSPARVMRYVLSADGYRIARAELLDRNLPVADEPTIGAILNGEFFYVANSQWDKFNDKGVRLPGTTVAPVVVIGVKLPK